MYLENYSGRVEVPTEDYIFHMIIKQQKLISSTEETYIETLDFSKKAFIFRMTILEASRIMDLWPDFATGLVGTWKLGTSGFLSLIKCFESQDPDQIEKFLQDASSHDLMRQNY
jgi:hypothetical protein